MWTWIWEKEWYNIWYGAALSWNPDAGFKDRGL